MRQLVLLFIAFISILELSAQPFYNTDVENPLVKENSFIYAKADYSQVPEYNKEVISRLPQPVWKNNPAAVNSYWRAWEIAFSNLKTPKEENGFISPYIDPSFNGNIFMWDCAYMTMFGKYAKRVFNFQNTLNNFYAKQHKDGFICREIRGSDGTDVFQKFDASSTGPDIFPWSEWEYFLNFNDKERLERVFPVLLSYYRWYRDNRTWPDGSYFSTGWGCGMDNQPRVSKQYNEAWSHGFMSWIDIMFQEVFSGKILIKMSKILDRENEVSDIKNNVDFLEKYVNTEMWNDETKFYFDRYRDGSLSDLKSIASYWALLAEVVPDDRLGSFVEHLSNTKEFARNHRVSTLSADSEYFNADGGYWNGSVWAPTNYMVLRGLSANKQDSLAFEIAKNNLDNVTEVFKTTGTFFENYAPDKVQGNDKKDFVGWTGLVPINVLIEYVFGIRADVENNTLTIDVNLIDEYGIRKYPFGKMGLLNIMVKERKDKFKKPEIIIDTNVSFKLIVKWSGGDYQKMVKSGKINIK